MILKKWIKFKKYPFKKYIVYYYMNYFCDICKKDYKSYKSVWNHNSKFHADKNIIIKDNKIRNFECSKCNKKYTTKQSMLYHNANVCKNNDIIEINKNNDIIEINKDNDIIELKKQVVELQKIVLEKNNTNNSHNNNNNNNNTINNTTNNIVYINKTGTEDYLQLNEKEKADIFSKEICRTSSNLTSQIRRVS